MFSNYDEKADINASLIESEIDDMSRGHWQVVLITRDYAGFWGHAKNISQMFKELKPLRVEDRKRLWEKYSDICDETKQKQDDEYQEKRYKSEDLRKSILAEVSSAEVNDLFGFDPPDVEEMKRLSQVLKSARAMVGDNSEDLLGRHRYECRTAIDEVQRSHDAWWDDLKRHRSQKHEEYQERVRNNLEKNRERLRKATDALDRCNTKADELRDKISSAWNDDWADTARGWLSELEDRISDIEKSIEEIEGWIEEDEGKLD